MENKNVKSFFLFSLSVTLLFACCAGVYYIWQSEQEKTLQRERRKQLDKAYEKELWHRNCDLLDLSKDSAIVSWVLEEIEKAKLDMRKDGYDFAEIQEIENKAYQRARKFINRDRNNE
jgi:hypothetical protein